MNQRPPRLLGPEHVRRYQESGGEDGHAWDRTSALLLTTRGRRSGAERTTALIYGQDGEDYLVVASYAGRDRHPAWYLNLEADPEVTVQVGPERFHARARTAAEEERPRLWDIMRREWPPYDEYQGKTARRIPIVVLERFPGS